MCFLVFILLTSLFPIPFLEASLPPEILQELHTYADVAILDGSGWSIFIPFLLSHYPEVAIDTSGLWAIDIYDLLILNSEADSTPGRLSTEEINTIVEFVNKGGDLIIAFARAPESGLDCPISESLDTLLNKLGLIIMGKTNYKGKEFIIKENMINYDSPISIGIEKIEVEIGWAITSVESNGQLFIISPFIGLTFEYGFGRVVFLGFSGSIHRGLSYERLGVNIMEWTLGYTPPEWKPSVKSTVRELEDQVETLETEKEQLSSQVTTLETQAQELLSRLDELESQLDDLSDLQTELEKLQSENEDLETINDELSAELDNLQNRYEELNQDYNKLNSEYESLALQVPSFARARAILIATTIIFAISTAFFALRRH